jgi:dipeptidyl aminopeptidase/acylaminoacyl peptidase
MAFPATDPDTPTEVYVSTVPNFNPVKLTDLNPYLKELAFGQTEVIRWKSTDGMQIEGLLVKPVGYQSGKRYPLLTYAHGGPTGAFKMSFAVQFIPGTIVQMEPYPVQVLAGQGYAIFMPNPRGSAGYGEKFRKGSISDFGGGDYRDIISGIDYLIGQGIADSNKLGIMGGSYGGYMTAWAITQTDRFKVASVYTGQKNLVSTMREGNGSGVYDSQFFSDTPLKARQEKEQRSPINFAASIKTPVLLQQGEADNVNPLPQSYEFYNALRERKVPVEFAVYPRQGHYVTEPKLQVDMLGRNINWFDRWLKEN